MGRALRAPSSRDLEQWKKVQALHAAGFRFSSYRRLCPALPARYSQVAALIGDNPVHPLRVAGPAMPVSMTRPSARVSTDAS
jgi:hypothetical protein